MASGAESFVDISLNDISHSAEHEAVGNISQSEANTDSLSITNIETDMSTSKSRNDAKPNNSHSETEYQSETAVRTHAHSDTDSQSEVQVEFKSRVDSSEPGTENQDKDNADHNDNSDGSLKDASYLHSTPMLLPPTNTKENTGDSNIFGVYHYFQYKSGDFFSSSDHAFHKAVEEISESVYDPELDGPNIIGSWLLMEVDHWDNETEKIVVLTDESLLTVRYDFVPRTVYKYKRVALKDFDTVLTGHFEYPANSLLNYTSELKKRPYGGVRLMWNKGELPGFFQRWNPRSDTMPWQTYTHHPLVFTSLGSQSPSYSLRSFVEAFVEAVNKILAGNGQDQVLTIKEEPLHQSVYLGFSSQIHNQSFLGMSKNRGPVSF